MKRTPLDEAIGVPAGAAPVLLDVMSGVNAGQAIERQEKQGQKDACKAQQLPINGTSSPSQRFIWERLGFVFGDEVEDLFVNVTFPKGWDLRPTEHSMWSDLRDEEGRIRAKMFYKAAFYDRDATISLCARFTINQYDSDRDNLVRISVYDGDALKQEPIHVIETECDDPKTRWKVRDKLTQQAKDWLNETYPDWANPLAYW